MNPDEPLRTKNLAEEDPAPMDDTLGGYSWLPRMIDKARASRAGGLGHYFRYPCPIDSHALQKLGIDAEAFATLACRAKSGHEVLQGMLRLEVSSPDVARFDPTRLNADLHRQGS